MAAQYTVKTGSGAQVDPRIVSFFQSFYKVTDDGSEPAHQRYVDYLTPTATLVMGTRRAEGRDQILALRKANWAAEGPVASRNHTVGQVFPFGPAGGSDGLDTFLWGTVEYGLRNGKTVALEWAAHAIFQEGGDDVQDQKQLRMKFYQVYLDSSVLAAAAAASKN